MRTLLLLHPARLHKLATRHLIWLWMGRRLYNYPRLLALWVWYLTLSVLAFGGSLLAALLRHLP